MNSMHFRLVAASTLVCTSCISLFADDCPPTPVPATYYIKPLVKLATYATSGTSTADLEDAMWYANEQYSPTKGLGVLSRNSGGEIVGTYLLNIGGTDTPRPFLWLPVGNYGLSAGMHDLLTLDGVGGAGFACDISDLGIIVGGVGGMPDVTNTTALRTLRATSLLPMARVGDRVPPLMVRRAQHRLSP